MAIGEPGCRQTQRSKCDGGRTGGCWGWSGDGGARKPYAGGWLAMRRRRWWWAGGVERGGAGVPQESGSLLFLPAVPLDLFRAARGERRRRGGGSREGT